MSFDIPWVASLVMGNLHWVFAIFIYVFISSDGKSPLRGFLGTVLLPYAIVDLFAIAAWIFVPVGIFTIVQFIMSIFFENTSLEKHYLKIVVALFVMLGYVHTFYFEFPWAV